LRIVVVVIFIAGLALVLAEMLLPGITIGFFGLVAIVGAIYLAFGPLGDRTLGWTLLVAALVLAPVVLLLWPRVARRLALKTTEASYAAAEPDLKDLIGREGLSVTPLRPAGVARFGERRVDVVADGEAIDKDTRVRVVAVEGNRVVVRAVRG